MKKILISLSGITVVIVAAALLYHYGFYEEEQTKEQPLSELVRKELPGWSSADVPLAQSEEMKDTVEGILNFDDVLFRSYSKDGTQFTVYVAYWEPRKMPIRLVQAHTPDICWVRNGWEVLESEYAVTLQVNDVPLKPAEYRLMRNSPEQQHVYYWHVVGDDVYTTKSVGTWSKWDPIKSFFSFGLRQKQEQYFVRVASNRPFDELWNTPGFRVVMSDLAAFSIEGIPQNNGADGS